MARGWPAEGGQCLTSADPCRQNAVIHTERASSEVEEMGKWEGSVERERGWKKESGKMGLERWWDRKSRKPKCRTRMNGSSVTHSEESLEARPEDRN